ncbi:hypothetical protein ANCDUO_26861 [Ancylostoma duodenale]|uniref:Uncharacterized protein n=1 Tax=Ancylostoma duodenale TaxID=51022 RepID=A0A0C2F3M5_9BILA|nr:hypothetical protein ANCDUO_26861 [Ancylostoma duodenale]
MFFRRFGTGAFPMTSGECLNKANEFTALQPEYLVVGEPTELKFATIQKGALKASLAEATSL